MRRLLMSMVVAVPWVLGCWATTTRVEPMDDRHVRFEQGVPQPHLRTVAVSMREEDGGLTFILVKREMCSVQEVRSTQERVTTKVEASPVRWVPASVLVGATAGGVVIQATQDNDEADGQDDDIRPMLLSSALLLGLAAAVVTIPTLAERERTHTGATHYRSVPAPERPCGQAVMAGASVAVRTAAGLREGITDAQGRVRFEGLTPSQVQSVFVDNVRQNF
jgi:hypothetical protein